MYSNLKAEAARKNITNRELAKCLNCHENTIGNIFKGKGVISVEEAFKLKTSFFPELDFNYLFKKE